MTVLYFIQKFSGFYGLESKDKVIIKIFILQAARVDILQWKSSKPFVLRHDSYTHLALLRT